MNSRSEATISPSGWRSVWEVLRHRRLAIGILLGLLVIVGGVTGWVAYDVHENRRLDAESVALVADLTVGFDAEVRVSDFLEKLDGELVDDVLIETTELGMKEVGFEYINIRGRRRPYSFTIEVVDEVAPVIYGVNSYTVARGYAGDLTDLMLSGDDLDDQPVRKVVGEYDLNKVGRYELEYTITDASGNETRQNFVLNVVEPTGTSGSTSTARPKYDFAEATTDHKTKQAKIGIDVSSWQGEVDWQKVKQAGAEFAFIRLGYQTDYGGEYVLDKYFKQNIAGALVVGLPVGVYFYSYADSVDQARAQATWVREQLEEYEVELGVAFDWEDWKNFNQVGMSFRTINQVAKTFVDEVAAGGYQGLLYGSKNYLEKIWQPEGVGVWLAQYYDRVTYDGEYRFWQLSDTGRIDGVRGDVDIDVWYF